MKNRNKDLISLQFLVIWKELFYAKDALKKEAYPREMKLSYINHIYVNKNLAAETFLSHFSMVLDKSQPETL